MQGAIRKRGWGSDDEGEDMRGRRMPRLEELDEGEIQKRVVLKKVREEGT